MIFRVRKLWLFFSCTVLGVLAGIGMPSFAFDYAGIHWPDDSLPVVWEVRYGTGDCTGELQAVLDAYQTWEDVSCSYFTESYGGLTYQPPATLDGHNVVSWYYPQEDSIGICYYWYVPSTGEIVECDIVFNDYFDWSSTGEAGKYDVQNIATHEFGHTLNLGDLYGGEDTEKTMYGYGFPGETKKRTLQQDDIDGICYIYPITIIVIPTGTVVYPNPFSLSRHNNLTFWGTGVPYAKIRIFTLGGKLVKTLDEKYGASKVSWDGRNEKGDKVARGIYVYVVDDSTRKIAVVK